MNWKSSNATSRLIGCKTLAGGLVGCARMNLGGLGLRIAYARKLKSLTQRQLAPLVGVHYVTIAMWELGRSLPSLNALALIADAIDTTIPYLLGYEGYDEPLRVFTGEIPLRTTGKTDRERATKPVKKKAGE